MRKNDVVNHIDEQIESYSKSEQALLESASKLRKEGKIEAAKTDTQVSRSHTRYVESLKVIRSKVLRLHNQ